MGRVQTFDTDDAVRAARTVFWKQGYESASLPALEQATGLNRSSIYHAFGSKRGLFDAAVDSYLNEVIRPRLEPLTGPDASGTAIVDYLDALRRLLADAGSTPSDSGCLLINTACAPLGEDAAVRDTIASYRAELRAAIGNGIDARHADRPAAERAQLADSCTGLVIAALALTRVDRVEAEKLLGTALDLVRE